MFYFEKQGTSLYPDYQNELLRRNTCRVCGDTATGHNFSVITCESCKAFFRRNALKPKEFRCPYSENCEINPVSRRYCQKCRLRRCFAVGMKKEWILNEEQLRRRKNSRLNIPATQHQQMQTNHMVRRQARMTISPVSVPAHMEAQLVASNGLGVQHLMSPSGGWFQYPLHQFSGGSAPSGSHLRSMQIIQGQRLTTPQERYFESPTLSIGGPSVMQQSIGAVHVAVHSPPVPQATSPQYGHSLLDSNINSPYSMDQSTYISKTIEDALMVDSPNNTGSISSYELKIHRNGDQIAYGLNASELRAIEMVANAFRALNDPVEAGRQRNSFLKDIKEPADVMNVMDVAMRRLVKMAKSLSTFNELSQEGKFSLLKASMIEMLTLRGVTRFDSKAGSFRSPTLAGAEVPINFFEKLNKDFCEDRKTGFLRFFCHFTEELRSNEIATSIIMLIVLFSARDDVISDENDRKLILKFHHQYRSLFNRYIESLYGAGSARLTDGIPVILSELKEIAENSANLFLGTLGSATNDTEPLPKEIFKVE